MSRNISFALTTRQFNERTKDVTRRLGWEFLKVGDRLHGCKKCMGLRPDEPLVRLHDIEVTIIRRERLDRIVTDPVYGSEELRREGFPFMSPDEFVAFFCASHPKCTPESVITRIEFKHL